MIKMYFVPNFLSGEFERKAAQSIEFPIADMESRT